MAGQPTEPVDVHEIYGAFGDALTNARKDVLAKTVTEIRRAYLEGREWDCYVHWTSISVLEEQLWMQLQLEAPVRTAIKRFQQSEREYDDRHH